MEHKARIYVLALADLGTMPRKTNMFSLITPQGKEIQLDINTVGLKMQSKIRVPVGRKPEFALCFNANKKHKNK